MPREIKGDKMRKFPNIAKFVKTKRLDIKNLSQSKLSHMLGYGTSDKIEDGQFLSNIERGKCTVPIKKVRQLAQILNIDEELIKQAMVKDYLFNIEESIEKTDRINKE